LQEQPPLPTTVRSIRAYSAAIWLLVDNHRSIGDITDIVVETLDAPTEQVSMDVIAFLEDLEGKGLISWQ